MAPPPLIFILLFGIVIIFSCLTTASRAAFLSVVVMPFYCSFRIALISNKLKIFLKLMLIFLAFIFCTIFLSFMTSGNGISMKFLSIFDRLSLEEITQPKGRLLLWWAALKLSIINPFGYGLEYVRLVNSSYLSPPLDVTFKHDHLHSFYIANLKWES